ncbi:hypothetical protein SAMN05444274_106230 [Mariniphaga anaerophila]|uniref:ATP synthase I chain n=1 Tax=Mariniphaga anaerophila TaxID=1484053 RepID=A0A1M5CS99_9BACT|nr:hypothetical protein [Mariniphaga anaerophila]SHF57232.1 hypothetical protein SAMN05444274_106230 [Mariniphaga anaerophila]
MKKTFPKFFTKAITAAAILAFLGWVAFNFIFTGQYLPVLPWMLIFFLVVTLVSYYSQVRVAQNDPARFPRTTMLVSFLRLVVYSAFAFGYLAKRPEKAAVFVVCLAITYLVFTFIEVSDLSRVSRKSKTREK